MGLCLRNVRDMRSIHYITLKSIADSAYQVHLQQLTPSNSGCRVLNITKSSNLGEEGLSGSLPPLMALGLENPGECLAKCTVGLSGLHLYSWSFRASSHLAHSTAPFRCDLRRSQCHLRSVCQQHTDCPWWKCIPHSFQVLLLSPE